MYGLRIRQSGSRNLLMDLKIMNYDNKYCTFQIVKSRWCRLTVGQLFSAVDHTAEPSFLSRAQNTGS